MTWATAAELSLVCCDDYVEQSMQWLVKNAPLETIRDFEQVSRCLRNGIVVFVEQSKKTKMA